MSDELLATLQRLLMIPDLHSKSKPHMAAALIRDIADEVDCERIYRSDKAKAAKVTFGPKKRGAK